MENIKVISLGGSIIAPDKVDTEFLKEFHSEITAYLNRNPKRKLIFVTGGGGPARAYQTAYREISSAADTDLQDWIGIMATRLNGQLVKGIFGELCKNEVVTDPSAPGSFDGRIMVAAGWKPGWSTDFDAVVLAERFGADTVINLSNISKVYSADPKLDPDAVPLDKMSWDELKELVGDKWVPGKNVPFDPVATKKAAELNLTVITAAGKDIKNMSKLLENEEFEGTVIGPR
ncbi:MAG: UMP kinase [Spirochaetales bacterium]|uniref:Uridylate kinase n=1 Tax=Candidatus Thalassospirochaeta sargassi TaxID=3119039 RepID=A0AAJ1MJ74_9SPIO|nr:UMP kinase [Spirochaetales bacterium]